LFVSVSRRLAQAAVASQHFGLQAKFKCCLSFYQVWAVRKSVYGFELPGEYDGAMSFFDVLAFDVSTFIFPTWTCLGGMVVRLVFSGLWPLLMMFVIALCLLGREAVRKGSLINALLRTLEAFIFISFCLLPSVTRSLFVAFECKSFGYDDLASPPDIRSYLTASLNIECYKDDHKPIYQTAWFFIILWPVVLPLLYGTLLFRCRHAILSHQPSKLSRAVRFLWLDYEDRCFWFEMVELYQKLVLTNFLLFVNFDNDGGNKLLRLFCGLIISLFGLTMQLGLKPFRKGTDDAIASVVRLMLVLFFIMGILVKLCDTESTITVHSSLMAQVEEKEFCSTLVGVSTGSVVAGLIFGAGILVVLVPLSMFFQNLARSQAHHILLDAQTMEPPELLLGEKERYHLFLSHVWSTGQDQCALIKRQLQLLLPGVVVFLDVDDLQDAGDLEGYVSATGVMLFFLSKHYFTSRNCLREVKASRNEKRPLVLVHEQQQEHGGISLEVLRMECRKEMRSYVFDGRTAIEWHRVSHYQTVTLKLIATEMLRHAPKYHDKAKDSLTSHGSTYSKDSANTDPSTQRGLSLILPGEIEVAKLTLPQPVVLWCSPSNAGAAEIAYELQAALVNSGPKIKVVDRKPDLQELSTTGESAAMLLYLNKDTWTEQANMLERDVRATHNFAHGLGHSLLRMGSSMRTLGPRTLRAGGSRGGADKLKILLVHENDPSKGGCEFGALFGTTPQGLVNEGIYEEIAIALHMAPHRAVSLAIMAQALGATKMATWQVASRGFSKSSLQSPTALPERLRAALRIQASGRGMMVRKRVKRMLWARAGSMSRLAVSLKQLPVEAPSSSTSTGSVVPTNVEQTV